MKTDNAIPPSADLCTQCHEGKYQSVTKDYTLELRDGDQCTIANLAQIKCNQCGHLVLPWASALRVDRAVADHTEPVSAKFLKQTRLSLQPNMTLLAESLGLGSKTWMRWENGEQNMSRSMGYFIRAMAQFPEVYEWVADRGWRKDNAEEQATIQEPSSAIDETSSKVMQYLNGLQLGETAGIDEDEELDKFLVHVFNQPSNVCKQSSFNFRKGGMENVEIARAS
jgi:YgiT-type zinc finger domain-containing protein